MGMVNVIRQHCYFRLRIFGAVIALLLATERCKMTSEAKIFQMPDILSKDTITHALCVCVFVCVCVCV